MCKIILSKRGCDLEFGLFKIWTKALLPQNIVNERLNKCNLFLSQA